MEITRQYFERECCYNYSFEQDGKILEITFGGNLDLYWSLRFLQKRNLSSEEIASMASEEVKEKFLITKENHFVYSLFETLYEDIKDSRIFIPRTNKKEPNLDSEVVDDSSKDDEFDYQGRNEWYKSQSTYHRLFDYSTIEWCSDDEEYNIADRFTINKIDDIFVLEFIRPKLPEDRHFDGLHLRTPGSIHVRISNSGSRYQPYNIIFMRMFNKLQEYDPDYHQIHFEEMIYQIKKLTPKK